jgi:hypothetical protein
MIDVVCFCGCTYSFEGEEAACPRCGEGLSLAPAAGGDSVSVDAQLDELLRRPAPRLPADEIAA